MRVSKNYMVRKIADSYLVIPLGDAIKVFNGVITVNETAAFLIEKLKESASVDELVSLMVERYDISKEEACLDVKEFIQELRMNDMLIEGEL